MSTNTQPLLLGIFGLHQLNNYQFTRQRETKYSHIFTDRLDVVCTTIQAITNNLKEMLTLPILNGTHVVRLLLAHRDYTQSGEIIKDVFRQEGLMIIGTIKLVVSLLFALARPQDTCKWICTWASLSDAQQVVLKALVNDTTNAV